MPGRNGSPHRGKKTTKKATPKAAKATRARARTKTTKKATKKATGRDPKTGRFGIGNPGGPGNPHGGDVARLKAALLRVTTEKEILKLWKKVLELGNDGNLEAIKYAVDRVLGKPTAHLEVEGDVRHTIATVREGLDELAKKLRGRVRL